MSMTAASENPILPVPSRESVVARETYASDAKTAADKKIFSWFQSFPLILGVTQGNFFAGLAEAPDADGVSVCRMLCRARAVQQHTDLRMDLPSYTAYMLEEEPRSDGGKAIRDAREAWLALCHLAARKCPERADDVNAFIEKEKTRLALADEYIGRDDVYEDLVGQVWHSVAVDGMLAASKVVFTVFDTYGTDRWCIPASEHEASGEHYGLQLLNSPTKEALIQCGQHGWRAFGPRTPDRADPASLGEGLSWLFNEFRAHLQDRLSGHQLLCDIPALDRIAARLEDEDTFRSLFLPSI